MPPKRILVERSGSSRNRQKKGVIGSTYDALTSPENASIVRSIAMFGVRFPLPLLASFVARANWSQRLPSPSSPALGENSCFLRMCSSLRKKRVRLLSRSELTMQHRFTASNLFFSKPISFTPCTTRRLLRHYAACILGHEEGDMTSSPQSFLGFEEELIQGRGWRLCMHSRYRTIMIRIPIFLSNAHQTELRDSVDRHGFRTRLNPTYLPAANLYVAAQGCSKAPFSHASEWFIRSAL